MRDNIKISLYNGVKKSTLTLFLMFPRVDSDTRSVLEELIESLNVSKEKLK